MPTTYGTPNGLIGIRPFYTTGNYTERSSIISSNQDEWYIHFLCLPIRNTYLSGNYVNQVYLLQFYNSSTQTNYNYNTSLWMCLAPTELCISPYRVPKASICVSFYFLFRYSYSSSLQCFLM